MIVVLFRTSLHVAIMLFFTVALLGIAGAQPVAAQSAQERLCTGAGGTFLNGECSSKDGSDLFNADEENPSIFQNIANTLLFITGALSVIMLIIGGVRYVISSGEQQAVASAKSTILYAVIGLVITFLAFAAVQFVIDSLNA